MEGPIIVSWGGGRNSTAMLVGMHARGVRPDLILFADTGGEKPETYKYRDYFGSWLVQAGFPPVITVRKGGRDITLEEDCLQKGQLPSIAYGFKSCSHKYKKEPQEKYANHWPPAREAWEAGLKVRKFIGYCAGEERRAKIPEDAKYTYHYPLIDWGWGQEECVSAIEDAGLLPPPKSACFFCPSSKKREVIALASESPDLFERAVQIERNAAAYNTTAKGLGRHWAWESLVASHAAGEIDAEGKPVPKPAKPSCQLPLFPDPDDAPCGCYDGGDE